MVSESNHVPGKAELESRARILLVDDEPSILMSVEGILVREGYTVQTASTGEEAIHHSHRDPFDLVLTDLRLPDMDGISVLTEVKKNPANPGIVIFTGYASLESAIEALRLGAFDYLIKPCTKDELVVAVDRCLKWKRLSDWNRKLEVLYEVSKSITATMDMGEVLKKLAHQLSELTGLKRCLISMMDDEGTALVGQAANFDFPDDVTLADLRIPLRNDLACHTVLTEGIPLTIPDATADPRTLPDLARKFNVKSLLIIPIQIKNKPLGVIYLDDGGTPHEFTDTEVKLAQLLADQAAISIENARLYREEREKKETLRELSLRVINAQEEERRRISRELHDEAGQALMSLILHLEMFKTEVPESLSGLRQQLEEATHLTHRAIQDIRRLIADLRPTLLDDLGLVPTLNWYAKNYSKRHQIPVTLDCGEIKDRLPPELEAVLYRIIQESLTNVAKHAKARNVRIRLQRSAGEVRAWIEDDGMGFDTRRVLQRPRQSFGLMGMRERAELVGGKLHIHSEPNQGTRIEVVLPLRPSEKDGTSP
ncbi:MAG: response regulator [Acidobacteria bacterium]|nr:response regulator [Acidobacteriota bacterium]